MKMFGFSQKHLPVVALAILSGLIFISTLIYAQSYQPKVSNFLLNKKQSIAPGEIIATCVIEEGGDIPYKRYALVYTGFDGDSLKMIIEKTVVQWGGWGWSEVTWFSPMTEHKTCRVSLIKPECRVNLAPEVNVKLILKDGLGNIIAKASDEDKF